VGLYSFISSLHLSHLHIYRLSPKHQITLNENGNRGKLTEDPIITQLRVADEKILEEMEKTGTDFDKYNRLVTERHKLYLEYEGRATENTTRYLISTIRQNILTQIKVSVLEAELIKLTIRMDNLETKI
jgi:UDP-N-acetylenolpyruvoylglucosamine reductase